MMAIVICLLVLFLVHGFLTLTDLGIYVVRIQGSCLLYFCIVLYICLQLFPVDK
jgi:hypothetical protein